MSAEHPKNHCNEQLTEDDVGDEIVSFSREMKKLGSICMSSQSAGIRKNCF